MRDMFPTIKSLQKPQQHLRNALKALAEVSQVYTSILHPYVVLIQGSVVCFVRFK